METTVVRPMQESGRRRGAAAVREESAEVAATASSATVMFLIRSLDQGGAERQLVTLARALHQRGKPVVVVTFYGGGALEPELRAAGVPLRVLGKEGRWDVFPFLRRLIRVVREERPAVLHGYLSVSNLLVTMLRPLTSGARTVWSVRDSGMDTTRYDRMTRLTEGAEGALQRFADLVIANSCSGREQRVRRGYAGARMEVIPNGIDVARFRPQRELGESLRHEWGVAPGEKLVGMVARIDPMKDHPTFLRAAVEVATQRPDTKFVCVGAGGADYTQELEETTLRLGLGGCVVWAGARSEMVAVYNALDLLCSASAFGEGFSNVIGEAMSCGVGCVATDVGDAARIVGDVGQVVPPRDVEALAAALLRGLAAEPDPERARRRMVDNFSVDQMVDATERVLWPED